MKKRILFIMHLPPPVHGVSEVNQTIKNSAYVNEAYWCRYIDLSGSRETRDVGYLSCKKCARIFRAYISTLRSLMRDRIDLVYLTVAVKGLPFIKDSVFILLARLLGKKTVVHLHGLGIAKQRRVNGLMNWYCQLVFKGVETIHLSEMLFADVGGMVPMERRHVVQNGIQFSQPSSSFIREQDSLFYILYLAHLIEFKGYFDLLRAAEILKSRGHKFTLHFVGGWSGELGAQDRFDDFVKKNRLEDYVVLHGAKYGRDKEEILQQASVFVLPSHNECFPLCILEAMAHALPVVAANVGAVSEIIDDGQTGYIVPPKEPVALADKLEVLMRSPSLAAELGLTGRAKYRRLYTSEAFEQRLSDVLDQILSEVKG